MSDMSTPMLESDQHANEIAKRLPFACFVRTVGGMLSPVGRLSSLKCGLTFELTGMQRLRTVRRKLSSASRGVMPLRVRVEQPVRSHRACATKNARQTLSTS